MWDGVVTDFHLTRIRRLARRVVKAITPAWGLGRGNCEMPNRAVMAFGSINVPVIPLRY